MWHEMNCAICGYRESTDYDPRTEQQIQSICDKGCPHCGNASDDNPFWFQSGPDGEIVDRLNETGNCLGPVKWWPNTPTTEHQQRIEAGLCKSPPHCSERRV